MAAPDATAGAARPSFLGRFARALAGGYVSLVFGLHVGGFSRPWIGLVGAAAAFLVAAILAWAVLRRVFALRTARMTFWAVFAAHVGFWSVRGVLETTFREAGPVSAPTSASWEGTPQEFLAGVAEVPFELRDGDPLAGWGSASRRKAWPDAWGIGPAGRLSMDVMGRSSDGGPARVPMLAPGVVGAEKRLGARALVLRPAPKGLHALVICRLDLVVSDARVHRAVLEKVRGHGIDADTLLLAATHTHSGPGGFSNVRLACLAGTDHFDPGMFSRVVDAAALAIVNAYRTAVPARIGFVRAHDRGADGRPILARNRRDWPEKEDEIDDEVLGMRVDAAEGGKRIALLLNYAVHPIWLRPGNVEFSADLAGHLERSAAIGDGAMVLFVNGAEGDISPRAKKPTPEDPRPLEPFENAVAPALKDPRFSNLLHIAASGVRRDLGSAYSYVCQGGRARFFDTAAHPFGRGAAGIATGILALPVNAAVWSAGLDDVRLGFTFDGAAGAVAGLDPYLDHTTFPFGAVRLTTPEATAVILWTPVEATHTVGLAMKASARARGADPVFVFGLTNDAMAYCASPEEYYEGGYEALTTLFGPETSLRVRESVDAALDAVGFRSR